MKILLLSTEPETLGSLAISLSMLKAMAFGVISRLLSNPWTIPFSCPTSADKRCRVSTSLFLLRRAIACPSVKALRAISVSRFGSIIQVFSYGSRRINRTEVGLP